MNAPESLGSCDRLLRAGMDVFTERGHAVAGASLCAGGGQRRGDPHVGPAESSRQFRRPTIIFLISAMALAGLRPLGHAAVQLRMVWQWYRRCGSAR